MQWAQAEAQSQQLHATEVGARLPSKRSGLRCQSRIPRVAPPSRCRISGGTHPLNQSAFFALRSDPCRPPPVLDTSCPFQDHAWFLFGLQGGGTRHNAPMQCEGALLHIRLVGKACPVLPQQHVVAIAPFCMRLLQRVTAT